tara:strand:- start:165 stop:341 length:177 start_codon:yes stop_codon:yes gene_type:complete
MRQKYELMNMPNSIKIAVPLEEDERINAKLLLMLRNNAWRIAGNWEEQANAADPTQKF